MPQSTTSYCSCWLAYASPFVNLERILLRFFRGIYAGRALRDEHGDHGLSHGKLR